MSYLLDTHVWIWWRARPSQLNPRVLKILKSANSKLYLSAASAWEISIKAGTGRIKLREPVEEFLVPRLSEDQIDELPVSVRHAIYTTTLPHLHRDPFDRLLIAQSRCENMTLITGDDQILQYRGHVLDAR